MSSSGCSDLGRDDKARACASGGGGERLAPRSGLDAHKGTSRCGRLRLLDAARHNEPDSERTAVDAGARDWNRTDDCVATACEEGLGKARAGP